MLLHEISVGTESHGLGCFRDGRRLKVLLKPERLWKVRLATEALLRRKRCSGKILEVLIGHLTYCFLVRRPLLSIFNAVCKFIQAYPSSTAMMWESVRDELFVAKSLLFLAVGDWTPQWSSTVYCADACESGYGVCTTFLDRAEVAKIGRLPERSRYR